MARGRQWQFRFFKKAEQSSGCTGETLLALFARKKRLQRKVTKSYNWIGVQISPEWIVIAFLSVFV